MPDGLSGWLGQAIGDGHLQRGQLLYQGPVKIDKSRQQDRTFQMRYQGEDVRLSFLPDWPQATGVNADVWINGREVQGVASRGNLLNSQVADVHVDVPAFDDETEFAVEPHFNFGLDGDSENIIVNGVSF